MIRSWFGIKTNPFDMHTAELLPHQQSVLDTLRVHCQQGGFCLVVGEPGCGKSVIKTAIQKSDAKGLVTTSIGRTLHTYVNTLRLLCESLQVDYEGIDITCERRLITEASRLNHSGKALAILVDDAHLMDIHCLRRLRLLLAEFPKNHNLILFAQAGILSRVQLTLNEDIRSRISYSAMLQKLPAEDIRAFILDQFDRCGLAHNTLSDDALALIARSSEGLLRNAVNLTLASLVEAVRDQSRTICLNHVNKALMQPHWRKYQDLVLDPKPQ